MKKPHKKQTKTKQILLALIKEANRKIVLVVAQNGYYLY